MSAVSLTQMQRMKDKKKDLGRFDLNNIEDTRRLTTTMQKHNKITFLNDVSGASPEQCVAAMLEIYTVDQMKQHEGLIGVSTQKNYTRRLRKGNELICHCSEPNLYQHDVICLDATSFDFATNLDVTVHFAKTCEPDLAERTEIALVCCNFTVLSISLQMERAENGRLIGIGSLIRAPNLFPMRHVTRANQSWIRLREYGRQVSQVDIHFHAIMVNKLLDTHWFTTTANLPVRVQAGFPAFDRSKFLESVPEEFKSRYTIPSSASS